MVFFQSVTSQKHLHWIKIKMCVTVCRHNMKALSSHYTAGLKTEHNHVRLSLCVLRNTWPYPQCSHLTCTSHLKQRVVIAHHAQQTPTLIEKRRIRLTHVICLHRISGVSLFRGMFVHCEGMYCTRISIFVYVQHLDSIYVIFLCPGSALFKLILHL